MSDNKEILRDDDIIKILMQNGVMANINRVLAEFELNITGQFLSTDAKVGYVITDIDKEYNKKVIKALKNIDGTIKFRVLY